MARRSVIWVRLSLASQPLWVVASAVALAAAAVLEAAVAAGPATIGSWNCRCGSHFKRLCEFKDSVLIRDKLSAKRYPRSTSWSPQRPWHPHPSQGRPPIYFFNFTHNC